MIDKDAYLGDGVYASFDGFQIWLAVNHPENKQVALDPQVMRSLLDYAARVSKAKLQRTELQIKTTDPFESARVGDYNRGWNDCLFASGIVKQTQRTWVGLTDDEMEATFIECGGKWNGDFWKIEDADFHPFLRTIEAKLKELNDHGI